MIQKHHRLEAQPMDSMHSIQESGQVINDSECQRNDNTTTLYEPVETQFQELSILTSVKVSMWLLAYQVLE